MSAADIAKAAIQAWEANDAEELASYLADAFIWENLLPQPANKREVIAFMKAVMKAFPDWSFNALFLNEHPLGKQGRLVHFVIRVTATHSDDFILLGLPLIPPTGTKIALPLRHMDWTVEDNQLTAITTDFSPNCLEEILAQLGMRLP